MTPSPTTTGPHPANPPARSTAAATPAVAVDRVSRSFAAVTALDDVSLTVARGESVGILGPNGAGKSTLLALLAGTRRPGRGSVRVLGGDPRDPATRRRLGCTPQQTGLPATLRVGEVVDLVAGHFPDPVPRGELLERFGLAELTRRQCGGLSGGQQRRLCVALAFAGRPDVVLLDEPTSGLDVTARRALWEAVRGFTAAGGTLLLSSHHLEEVEALSERVVVLGGGRVLADGPVADVRSRVALRRVRLRLPAGVPEPVGAAGAGTCVRDGERVELLVPDADGLVRDLVCRQVPFCDLEVSPASLEDAFLAITGAERGGRR
ncbi:ABC-2 type transport system ATP-binding protein [Kineococcus xinjiangensis]|uniref:ABC-2 type transport system ATP-binding protein n=1 Tax=Kineococcus xinjiangensis TaxID=512762 RepID=A0A2S6ICT4_9ACTN|nr:ABC transporter ATP-binding protein [Kineococcus xinjiangensis]PPK92011.1 ABC-2 type transport system ATP-binding protein [Kineococcus xinjiangensis]